MQRLFKPKFFTLFKRGFTRKQIIADSLAGVVVGVLALPLAIAFAVASGVSPERGLITAIVAGFLISFLGGSRVQIGGPTGAFIVIVYGIVENYGIDGLIISTVMAGFMLVGFGLLKLGSLLKYFPHPLIVGFTSGIALVIFSTQVKDALGLDIEKVPSAFGQKLLTYFEQIHTVNWYAIAVTLATIIITIYSQKIFKKIPGAFLAILLCTLAVQLFQLPVTNIASFFGEIPNSFNFSIPHVEWADLGNYVVPAMTIALLGGIESLLSAVVADGMIGGKHRSNTELIAQGVANIVTPFFGGIPATGAIARTATNVKNGGRTPIAGIVHAVTLLLIMLFLGKWAKLIPMSALAGVLIVVSYNMSEWRSFKAILKNSFFDSIILLTTFVLTVWVDLTVAIQVGVVLSALLFMKRMADMSDKNIDNPVDRDVLEDYSLVPKYINIYEISGPLFFASARRYAEIIEDLGMKSKILIIRMRHVPFVDLTGIKNFKDTIESLRDENTRIILSGVQPNVLEEFKKHNILKLINEKDIFNSFEDALTYAKTIEIKTK
ncbi:SulP family sulfate permease [Balneicella halophila]|uniref:SulP family sulfate permease n=2 Tax=Balneicella halophila TaxID=1537566 RepID=A0A7L4UQI7_BALHA|nr:SulP family sulfate permease [Balneicella halophila]